MFTYLYILRNIEIPRVCTHVTVSTEL